MYYVTTMLYFYITVWDRKKYNVWHCVCPHIQTCNCNLTRNCLSRHDSKLLTETCHSNDQIHYNNTLLLKYETGSFYCILKCRHNCILSQIKSRPTTTTQQQYYTMHKLQIHCVFSCMYSKSVPSRIFVKWVSTAKGMAVNLIFLSWFSSKLWKLKLHKWSVLWNIQQCNSRSIYSSFNKSMP